MTCRVITKALLALLTALGAGAVGAAAQTPGVTDDTILIGVIGAMSGSASYTGAGFKDGALLYFDEINAAGGVHGRKIKTLVEDDACSPAQSRAVLIKLIERDQVFALFGGNCSNAIVANVPILVRARIPYVVSFASDASIIGPDKPMIFRNTAVPTDTQGRILANYIVRKLGAKRVSILYDSTEYGKTLAKFAAEQFTKLGTTPLTQDGFNLGDTDFTSQLVRIKQANPEVVLLASWQKEYLIQMRQVRELGIQTTWLGSATISDVATTKLVGDLGVGTLHYSFYGPSFVDSDEPHMARFRQAFRQKYPNAPATKPDEVNMAGYGASMVYVEALKRAGRQLSRGGFVKALESLKGFETGFIFPITLSEKDHQGMKGGKIFRVGPGAKMEWVEQDLSKYWE